MTSTYFWDFLTPPPSLYAKYIRFVRKFAAFLDPLSPFYADVMYGSPRRRRRKVSRSITINPLLSPFSLSTVAVL